PVEKLLHAKVVGTDAVERADGSPQDVEPSLDQCGLLDRGRVLRFLDDAELRPVPRLVAAHPAEIALGDVAAFVAERDPLLLLNAAQCFSLVGSLLFVDDLDGWRTP